jgi:dTDP-4-amino-4,6-dideoxygalactose transaminase
MQYIPNYPGIAPPLLAAVDARRLQALPAWLPRGRTLLLPCCRNAIYLGVQAMGLRPGDQVLVPSFVCTTVTLPLEQAGIEPVFIRVHTDLSLDWEDIHARLQRPNRIKSMLWYHFLGLSVGFDKVLPFCRQHRLLLIEDCAHALFAQTRGRPVGSFGDIATFSISKTLPALRAGALVVNNRRMPLPHPPISPLRDAQAALLRDKEIFLHRIHLQAQDFHSRIDRPTHLPLLLRESRLYRDTTRMHEVDETSRLVMHNADPAEISRIRSRNFKTCLLHLPDMALFKKITPGAAPLGFPVIVPDRDGFRKRLQEQGVEALCHWPEYLLPKGVAGHFPEAVQLANSILSLPCHQDLGTAQIEYVCRAARKARM